MASKREEERNEKILRGLMKLPPNRRCMNCSSLGPQYVCTNFWTFICMICSGIHREFTHRVKSVSMSKFTSQEVEALQNGGNQRAREIYLKDWDLERQRLPNSSDVDKVREFIKAVYVDRNENNIGDETRRASSYHSYSQSPPYDFQYEDRLKRKQGGPIVRKPGSGLYERKAASFAYSPGRFRDHIYECRFANEGSSSRVSDYSVSSRGDPFRSAPQSPNLQQDEGCSSPTVDFSREIVSFVQRQPTSTLPEASAKGDADRVPLPRPQSAATTQNKVRTFPAFSQPAAENSGEFNLFEDPLDMPAPNSGPDIDLFRAPTGSLLSVDLFQTPAEPSPLPQKFHTPPTSLLSSSRHFDEISQKLSHQPSVPSVIQKFPGSSDPGDEGWATLGLPQHNTPITNAQDTAVLGGRMEAGNPGIYFTNTVLSSTAEVQWPDFQQHGPALLVSNPWDEHVHNFPSPAREPDNEPWKVFEADNGQQPFVGFQHGADLQISHDSISSSSDQYPAHKISEGSGADGSQKLPSGESSLFPTLQSHVATGSSFNQPILPFMIGTAQIRQKSGNPFDIDSELEGSNVFLGMGSLQDALPSVPLPASYVGGINESWFPSSAVASQGNILAVLLTCFIYYYCYLESGSDGFQQVVCHTCRHRLQPLNYRKNILSLF
ncbi:hypothetical protein Cgig2_010954 [Carnegiea gigantea]|uniref:Arf-GAP domain-containing protein n=1 Tax=Carnegiea gigantea TaxID=171969 RepID=A0A9Q1GQB9_9CARY|nr:hypothetical protein Cgig2_010954 [Carnegiea gigantea]